MGGIRVLIPAGDDKKSQFRFGDTVRTLVEKVEPDGTLILESDDLELESDNGDEASSSLRKWKREKRDHWEHGSW